MDWTIWGFAILMGAFGGVAYDYYNGLVSYSTWLNASWHVVCGAFAGVMLMLGATAGGIDPTISYTWAVALVPAGYAGTDVIDTLVQQTTPKGGTPPAAPSVTGA